MPLTATGVLVAASVADGSAVLAFNAITLEHAEGIAEGAERARTAVIIQISENTIEFHGGRIAPLAGACGRIAAASSVPMAVHLDHLQDVELIAEAIDTAAELGVTSIMVDAAHLPYEDNVDRTRSFAAAAHRAGLWVEAELGEIGGKGQAGASAHLPGVRTDPDEAAAFTEHTAVDALAVAVGNTHAMTTRTAELDLELIRTLAARVPSPLVLHGSSGVPDAQLRSAVAAGIRKVNVGTALNLAYTGPLRAVLAGDPNATDPRTYLRQSRRAIGDAVAALCLDVVPSPAAAELEAR